MTGQPVAEGKPCPCGLANSFAACCEAFHLGVATPPTAERLMRSRYSAFAVGNSEWLLSSWHPSTRPQRIDLDKRQRWTGLDIVATTGGGLFDAEGTVTFVAHYALGGSPGKLNECSVFRRDAGVWRYVGPVLIPKQGDSGA